MELILFSAVAVILISGFVSLAASFVQLSVRNLNKLQAFSIAESGIEYYRWHLAHAPTDYQDGTGHAGPYVHNYYDKNGVLIGAFTLTITPPPAGSTVVTIQSAGSILADPSINKIISVKMGVPSFAQYAWVLNDNVFFGSTAQVYGTIQSNAGIHFDGVAHNLVSSALTTYTDPDSGLNEWAVYTDGPPADSQPPTAMANASNTFLAGRAVGVPMVDFTAITQNLSNIKAAAQASGTYFGSSTVQGWNLQLATSGVYSVYKVTSLVSTPSRCTNDLSQTNWGLWSVGSSTLYATGTIPANGQMFFEDNLWVQGQINNKRLTIGSARFPDNASTRSSITVNHNLLYTNFNGSDTISLIAQNNINVGLMSDDNLYIDGALIAQNGWVGRYYYNSNCGTTQLRTSLNTLGMLGTSIRSAFYYSGYGGGDSGYQTRIYTYDSNLLYAPPPGFPLTTAQYTPISWTEVQ